MSAETAPIRWVRVRPPFGGAWAHGCCAAFVDNTVCGWPRREDGTCEAGHPAQPEDAPTHSIADLMAAERVLRIPPVSSTPTTPTHPSDTDESETTP